MNQKRKYAMKYLSIEFNACIQMKAISVRDNDEHSCCWYDKFIWEGGWIQYLMEMTGLYFRFVFHKYWRS